MANCKARTNIITEHPKGTIHGNVDALPRRPCVEDCIHCKKMKEREGLEKFVYLQIGIEVLDKLNVTQLIENQRQDVDISPILEAKSTGQAKLVWYEISGKNTRLKNYWTQWDSLVVEDGLLKLI